MLYNAVIFFTKGTDSFSQPFLICIIKEIKIHSTKYYESY
jgi:hypothetical protein